jgi:5-methyltetrahydrofolate--homocysteine methyltransferase
VSWFVPPNIFGVAWIEEDQVADYAARRGLELDKARQYLRPNLNE